LISARQESEIDAMIQIDLHQAQAELPRYLEQVAQGETIVICKDDQPIAELRPVAAPRTTPRPLGLAKGLGEIHPSFFEPLPDDLLALFNGEGE
jgi:antitoxin (DNA-binding transcriptional repressor) of toxin-antitoxin stability system